jgi:hypothetical protein
MTGEALWLSERGSGPIPTDLIVARRDSTSVKMTIRIANHEDEHLSIYLDDDQALLLLRYLERELAA